MHRFRSPGLIPLPMIVAVVTTALLTGCEPPPPVDVTGDPQIRLLYPDEGVPIPLDPDGNLAFLVVVDILDFDFLPGGADSLVEGQGHWHLNLNDVYVDSPTELFYEVSQPGWQSQDAIKLSVTLQDNQHGDLDQFDGWEAIYEFVVQ